MPIQEAGGAVRLYQGQPTTTSALLFTNNQNELKAVIREILLAQNATTGTTISLQAGANNSAATGNIVPTNFNVLGAGQAILSMNVVLNPGDTIWGLQQIATGITVTISGEYVA